MPRLVGSLGETIRSNHGVILSYRANEMPSGPEIRSREVLQLCSELSGKLDIGLTLRIYCV